MAQDPSWLNDINTNYPILDIGQRVGHTHYIDFLEVDDLTHPIMRGVDVFRRPFISFRVLNRNTGKLSVHTLFKRYTDESCTMWCYGTHFDVISDSLPREGDKEFLHRLLQHEPCGAHINYQPEGERLTKDGLSVLEII